VTEELGGRHRTPDPAVDHDLRADVGRRLDEDRVHVDRRRDATGFRLHRLRAADLEAFRRRGGIERHVLRLERRHAQPAIRENPAERRR
jgi:hypothetical protein